MSLTKNVRITSKIIKKLLEFLKFIPSIERNKKEKRIFIRRKKQKSGDLFRKMTRFYSIEIVLINIGNKLTNDAKNIECPIHFDTRKYTTSTF